MSITERVSVEPSDWLTGEEWLVGYFKVKFTITNKLNIQYIFVDFIRKRALVLHQIVTFCLQSFLRCWSKTNLTHLYREGSNPPPKKVQKFDSGICPG